MFKKNMSDRKLFWIYFSILLFAGFVLFVLSARLYTPFKDIIIALDSKESVPILESSIFGFWGILIGVFWMSFYILFESAKKGLVDLIHKK